MVMNKHGGIILNQLLYKEIVAFNINTDLYLKMQYLWIYIFWNDINTTTAML